jgi:hypothetical protein
MTNPFSADTPIDDLLLAPESNTEKCLTCVVCRDALSLCENGAIVFNAPHLQYSLLEPKWYGEGIAAASDKIR